MKLSKKKKTELTSKLSGVFGKICSNYGIDFSGQPEDMTTHEKAYFDGVMDSLTEFENVIKEFFEIETPHQHGAD